MSEIQFAFEKADEMRIDPNYAKILILSVRARLVEFPLLRLRILFIVCDRGGRNKSLNFSPAFADNFNLSLLSSPFFAKNANFWVETFSSKKCDFN